MKIKQHDLNYMSSNKTTLPLSSLLTERCWRGWKGRRTICAHRPSRTFLAATYFSPWRKRVGRRENQGIVGRRELVLKPEGMCFSQRDLMNAALRRLHSVHRERTESMSTQNSCKGVLWHTIRIAILSNFQFETNTSPLLLPNFPGLLEISIMSFLLLIGFRSSCPTAGITPNPDNSLSVRRRQHGANFIACPSPSSPRLWKETILQKTTPTWLGRKLVTVRQTNGRQTWHWM